MWKLSTLNQVWASCFGAWFLKQVAASLLGSPSCTKPADYPLEIRYAAGAFANGKARICGGYYGGDISDCYEYSLGDDSWTLSDYSLSEDRYYHVSGI